MNKIRIIDLLNKIANGETPPKRFLWKDEVFTYSEEKIDYVDGEGDWLFLDYTWQEMLNDEVEIIEDNKKIAELPIIEENELFNIRLTFNQDRRKINELIDEVNKLKENQ